jgi:hypothetical protein
VFDAPLRQELEGAARRIPLLSKWLGPA